MGVQAKLKSLDSTCHTSVLSVCEGGGGDIAARIVVTPSDVIAVEGKDETAEFECVVNARSDTNLVHVVVSFFVSFHSVCRGRRCSFLC